MNLRFDRAATLCFFHPLRLRGEPEPIGVPVLMYHAITDRSSSTARAAYFETATSPRVVSDHLRLLYELGYSTVTVDEALRLLRSGKIPRKVVAITFDDGFADFGRLAWPLLSKYNYTATVYLPTAYIGQTTRDFKGHSCLTWPEVRNLHEQGISFGSHTVSHPQLRNLSWTDIEREVRESKAAIEEQIGAEVTSFAYPYAFPGTDPEFTGRLRTLLSGCGYQNGVCTEIGLARPSDDCYFLRRLPVNDWDDAKLFKAKIDGGYDWLYTVQRVKKRLRLVG